VTLNGIRNKNIRTVFCLFFLLKRLATNVPTWKFYDMNKPLLLLLDASSGGMGAVLLQDGRAVVYGSSLNVDMHRSRRNYFP
jgi:hypothetical protein